MKTTKKIAVILTAFVTLTMCLASCGGSKKSGTLTEKDIEKLKAEKPAPETDFSFKLSEDGSYVTAQYKGKGVKTLVYPATIQGLPVKEIRTNYDGENCDYDEAKKLTTIVIPEGVEVIGDFFGFDNLATVILPSTLKCIDGACFVDKKNLTSITLPEGLVAIGWSAFARTGLTSVSLPKSLKCLGLEAFFDCDSLEEINIPEELSVVTEDNGDEDYGISLKYNGNLYFKFDHRNFSGFPECDFTEIFNGEKIKESVALQNMLRAKKTVSIDYQDGRKYRNVDCSKWDW